MDFKHFIIVDGKKYTRNSNRKYGFVVVGKQRNFEYEDIGGYSTDYGEQYCGKEVIVEPFGIKSVYKCSIYSSKLDNPDKDAKIREKGKELYPNREIVVKEEFYKNESQTIHDKELGYKIGEYGSWHCEIHAHQKIVSKMFDYYAKRIVPEENKNPLVVLSWHLTYKNAENYKPQYLSKIHNGIIPESVYEKVEIIAVPEGNITEVQHRKKEEK